MDFAFFVVNFGYTRKDYDELTDREKVFIYKAYENKTVSWSTLMRDAVLNAVSNALRKKNKRFMKLWKKRSKKADKDVIKDAMRTITDIEQNEHGWIELIYKANGMKKGKKNNG